MSDLQVLKPPTSSQGLLEVGGVLAALMPDLPPYPRASSSPPRLLSPASVRTGSGTVRTACVMLAALLWAWLTTSPLMGSSTCSRGSASTSWCR